MTVGPGFPTEMITANTMHFLSRVELYCFAEGSGLIFRPLRQHLGGRRIQDGEVEMALREWKPVCIAKQFLDPYKCLTLFTEYF
jgi:hypothetical protein